MQYKKIYKILISLFVLGGLVLIFGKPNWFPDFYRPVFMGVMSFIIACIIMSLRFIFRPQTEEQEMVFNSIQAITSLVLVLTALGALGAYKLYIYGFNYDKVLHFFDSYIFVIAAIKLFYDWKKMPFGKAAVLSITIVFLLGVVWEIYEVVGDYIFGTQMAGFYGELKDLDMIWDFIFNGLGVIAAGLSFKFLRSRNIF